MRFHDARRRVVIENLRPKIDHDRFPAKRVIDEEMIFRNSSRTPSPRGF